MKCLPGEDADHQHIRDQHRAARHDAESHAARDEAGIRTKTTPRHAPVKAGEWRPEWREGVHYDVMEAGDE